MLQIIATALAAMGALYWASSVAVVLWTRHRLASLARLPSPARREWPRLSVIIPACNEEATLESSVRALLATSYPNLEVVLVDDRSADGTGALADRLAKEDSRLRVVHVGELPAGWLGKVHAMHRGTQIASGDWMLFCDADVHLGPQALAKAVGWCEERGVDFLSVLPQIEPATAIVDAAVLTVMRILPGGSRVWAVGDPKSSAVFGVGVFLLVRRAAFARTAGWEWLRLEVADDVGVALLMKRSGARCAAMLAAGEVAIRAYDSGWQMVRALEKNSYAILGNCSAARTLGMAATVALFELGPLAGLLGGPALWPAALAGVGLALASSLLCAAMYRAPLRAAWLFPAGVALLAVAMVRAAFIGARQGGVVWRGTLYRAEELRAGKRVRWP